MLSRRSGLPNRAEISTDSLSKIHCVTTSHRSSVLASSTETTMSQYPVPPPSYGAAGTTPKPNQNYFDERDERQPFMGPSTSAGYYAREPIPGDLPDDFKVTGA
jgi:hypothetical protein